MPSILKHARVTKIYMYKKVSCHALSKNTSGSFSVSNPSNISMKLGISKNYEIYVKSYMKSQFNVLKNPQVFFCTVAILARTGILYFAPTSGF